MHKTGEIVIHHPMSIVRESFQTMLIKAVSEFSATGKQVVEVEQDNQVVAPAVVFKVKYDEKVPREAIAHVASYLEGMLLRQPENSCESIQKSLKEVFEFVK